MIHQLYYCGIVSKSRNLDFSDKSSWQRTGWPHIYNALQLASSSQLLCFHVWSVQITNFSFCTRHINKLFQNSFYSIGYSLPWPGKLNLNLNTISPISATITSQRIITNSKKKTLHVFFVGLFVEILFPYAALASFEFMVLKPQPSQCLI